MVFWANTVVFWDIRWYFLNSHILGKSIDNWGKIQWYLGEIQWCLTKASTQVFGTNTFIIGATAMYLEKYSVLGEIQKYLGTVVFGASRPAVFGGNTEVFGGKYSGIWGQIQQNLGAITTEFGGK